MLNEREIVSFSLWAARAHPTPTYNSLSRAAAISMHAMLSPATTYLFTNLW